MSTQLKDRILHYDGTNQVDPDKVPSLFLHGVQKEKIAVNFADEDIELFNSLSDYEIPVAKEIQFTPDFTWKIPEEYLKLDLDSMILEKARALGSSYESRAQQELIEIQKRNLGSLFRTLVYVIDTLKDTKTLWGVGRGSSCASLVLFILGLHKVDPVRFNIPLEEFFHD